MNNQAEESRDEHSSGPLTSARFSKCLSAETDRRRSRFATCWVQRRTVWIFALDGAVDLLFVACIVSAALRREPGSCVWSGSAPPSGGVMAFLAGPILIRVERVMGGESNEV